MIYEELPDVTALQEICHGVFIAQAVGDLELEAYLFSQFIQILRSPEALLEIAGTDIHPEHGPSTELPKLKDHFTPYTRLKRGPAA